MMSPRKKENPPGDGSCPVPSMTDGDARDSVSSVEKKAISPKNALASLKHKDVPLAGPVSLELSPQASARRSPWKNTSKRKKNPSPCPACTRKKSKGT